MILSSLVLLASVMSYVRTAISVGKGFDQPTMMQDDIYVYYMDQVFDVSKAVGQVTFSTTAGKILDNRTPLRVLDLSDYGYAKVEAIEFINNQTFATVLDNRNAIIQTIDLEGLQFTRQISYSFLQLGAEIRCDDIDVYYPQQKAYVVCWDMSETPEGNPGNITLVEFDLMNTSNYRKIMVEQEIGFSIRTRVRVLIANLPQGGNNETYLIIHDQAISGTQEYFTNWFRYFTNIDNGAAVYGGLVKMSQDYPTLRTLYEIFAWNGQLLIVSSTMTTSYITMTGCSFYEFNTSIYCSPASSNSKVSSTQLGYVGLSVNNKFVTYDIPSNTLKTCDIGPIFIAPDWISTSCEEFKDIPKFEEAFIRIVEDNYHAKVISWVYPNGEFAGVSIHSRELNRSWKEEGTIATLINRQLYTVSNTNFTIRRLVYDNLNVHSSDIQDDEKVIQVTARDGSGSVLTLNLPVRLMRDAKDIVEFSPDHRLPEVDAYGGSSIYFPLTEDDYSGNDLKFTPTFVGDVKGLIDFRSFSTFPIEVVFIFKSPGTPKFVELTFTNNYAVGKDTNNRVLIFRCGPSEIYEIRCDEQYSFAVDAEENLQVFSREVLGYVFAWTKDKESTRIFLFGPDSTERYEIKLNGAADDAHALVYQGRVWIFASYQTQSQVLVRSWSPVNPTSFTKYNPITAATSSMPYFCPTDVFDTYDGVDGYLEIQSTCYNPFDPDQRIFKYNLANLNMVGTHPINLNIINPIICAIGDSYIIGSVQNNMIEGRAQYADQSRYFFYLNQFVNYTKFLGMSCAADSGMVSIYFEDKNHKIGFATIWGDSLKQANKRVHSVMTEVSSSGTYIQSFSVRGIVVHTVYDSIGAFNYWMTLSKVPILKMDFLELSNANSSVDGTMVVSLNNGGTTGGSVQAAVTIRKMDSSISFTTTGNKNKLTTNFSVEDYVTIKGHVFNGTLLDKRSDKSDAITLTQRASKVHKWDAPEIDQVIFQHIESHGEYTIALHMDKSFASFFTIFTKNFENQGVIQPRDGVQSFDFATLTDGRALLGYSSALVSGNNLKFMLIRGKDRLSEASVSGTYSKLRFAQIDANDNLLLFGMNDDEKVDVFVCNVSKLTVNIEKVHSFTGVTDFDVTDSGDKITVFYTSPEAIKLHFKSWSKSKPRSGPIISDDINIQGEHLYWLQSVACVNEDNTSKSACIVNTLGTKLIEVIVENGRSDAEVHNHYKYGSYEAKFTYIDGHYFAMRAVTTKIPREYAFLVFKRKSKGGDGNLYSGINIDGAARPGTDINSGLTPFTLQTIPTGESILVAGTHNPLEPIQFWKIDQFRVATQASASAFSDVFFEVEGYAGLAQMSSSLKEVTASAATTPWWPFLLGALGLLLFIIIGYYCCVYKKQDDDKFEAENTEGYRTIVDKDGEPIPKKDQKGEI